MNETAPSAWKLGQSLAAFQRAIASLDVNLPIDEQVIANALRAEGVAHPEELLTRTLDAYVWAKMRAEEADRMRKAFRYRRDRYLQRCEVLRESARSILEIVGKQKHSGTLARISLHEVAPIPTILNAELLSDEYVDIKTIRAPNKERIRIALADGLVVDGAAMSNRTVGATITRLARADPSAVDDEDEDDD